MTNMKYQLYLASQSPRRKELLSHLNIPFEVVTSDANEILSGECPQSVAEENAIRKGEAVFKRLNLMQAMVVSADTIVIYEEHILGKPSDRQEAKKILQRLSGKQHEVITSVYIKSVDRSICFSISSKVRFSKISDDIMDTYLATEDSLDKAGAYGIQSEGLLFVADVQGSYSNVVGFPLSDFVEQLKKCYKVDDYRKLFE